MLRDMLNDRPLWIATYGDIVCTGSTARNAMVQLETTLKRIAPWAGK